MTGRFFLPLLAVACLAGCPRWDSRRTDTSGTMTIARTAPRPAQLGKLDARARYCARDSVLSIVATSSSWSAAVAMHTGRPFMRRFTVATQASSPGVAALALRPLRDSIGLALVAVGGSIDLDAGTIIGGKFTAQLGSDTGQVKLNGTFTGIRADTTGCAAPAGG